MLGALPERVGRAPGAHEASGVPADAGAPGAPGGKMYHVPALSGAEPAKRPSKLGCSWDFHDFSWDFHGFRLRRAVFRPFFPWFLADFQAISVAQVAERTLFLWNNDYIVRLITSSRKVLFPEIIGALYTNSKLHWSSALALKWAVHL